MVRWSKRIPVPGTGITQIQDSDDGEFRVVRGGGIWHAYRLSDGEWLKTYSGIGCTLRCLKADLAAGRYWDSTTDYQLEDLSKMDR